ncbi:MAG: ribonuclease T2, partial [Hyphomicrobiales bacterium]|nr:ribonuclease T2 [Hyphomicrobiales bacterium]
MIFRDARTAMMGALAVMGLASAASAQTLPPAATAPFDFYVMTLSWSPGFCDTGGEEKSPEQCAVGSGDGFVVHGLWPDNRTSADPADCDPSKDASAADLAAARGLYPTDDLAEHEYAKHGTCTGLSATDYFAAVRYARDQLKIPDMLKAPHQAQRLSPQAIEQAFIDANANLHPDNMAVTCGHGELIDVRFCLTRNLKAFSTCPKVSGHTCQRPSVV